jgi:plasmid rolling circle replication initiator protein Rep
MSNNKQSSVEYLIDYLLPKALTVEQYYHIEKAKAMHKEEIIKAAADHSYPTHAEALSYAEQYYNETFNNQQ